MAYGTDQSDELSELEGDNGIVFPQYWFTVIYSILILSYMLGYHTCTQLSTELLQQFSYIYRKSPKLSRGNISRTYF